MTAAVRCGAINVSSYGSALPIGYDSLAALNLAARMSAIRRRFILLMLA
jgi:hypothetical protein